MKWFVLTKVGIKIINNAAEGSNLTHFANWCNMALVLILFKERVVDVLSKRKRENIVSMFILVLSVLVFVQP